MSELSSLQTIGILKTSNDNDPRVCMLPKEVRRLVEQLKMKVLLEPGLADTLQINDSDYAAAGATLTNRETILKTADFVISVDHEFNGEETNEDIRFIGIFNPLYYKSKLSIYREQKVSVYSLDLLPRTTLAQSMDVLSSMASLSGYRAIIRASNLFNGIFPMFTTAAGTLKPAKVLVLGAGVAGLQAIATARRLGAVVEAFDVRVAAGEEVRSLGATFIEVEGSTDSESAGGYAVEQTADYKARQKELIHQHIVAADIVVSTANIPGRKAPLLIETRSVDAMKAGSVIVDLAAEQGGNCELSKNDETLHYKGVAIIGNSNLAGEIPAAASQLLSNNFFSFIKYFVANSDKEDDPLVSGSRIIEKGAWANPRFKES